MRSVDPLPNIVETSILPHAAEKDKLTGDWTLMASACLYISQSYLLSLDFLLTKLLCGVKFLAFFIWLTVYILSNLQIGL